MGGGGGVTEKRTKTNRGRGVLAYLYVHVLKKNAEIFKILLCQNVLWLFSSFSYWLKTIMKPSWKIIIFSPVNKWRAIAFVSPHKITNVGYLKNIYFLRWTLFGASNETFVFKTRFKVDTGTKKPFS